jgi:cytochrome c553
MKSDMKRRKGANLLRTTTLVAMGMAMATAHAAAPAAAPQVDLKKGAEIAGQVCAACHAADGNSNIAENPILAGQHAGYLAKQLHNFQVRNGATKAERENAIMAGFAAMLSADDIRNVSAFYASQPAKGAYAANKDLLAKGQQIYRAGIPARGVPACVGCHAPNGAGIPIQYPKLSGQHAAYTQAQLTSFRSGARANSAQMMKIAAQMSDADISAVAEYIAGLR